MVLRAAHLPVLAFAMLAAPSALLGQPACDSCGEQAEWEPSVHERQLVRDDRAEARRAQAGNGKGGGNNGAGKGNGGNGDTNDGGVDNGNDPVEAAPDGCGNGGGSGSGNGTKGNGNGQACGDGSGNAGGGQGGGGSRRVPELFIQNEINFGRLIMLGNGESSVLIDLESGQKITAGNLDDYGGVTMVGRATVTGQPNSEIQVSFPNRITMRDPRGGMAELRDFATSLPIAPRLDNTGVLEFSFTGRLAITETIGDGGDLRGSVPITVEYN